jgi:hypothetical protein
MCKKPNGNHKTYNLDANRHYYAKRKNYIVKGTHARDFHGLFLTLFCIIRTLIYAKHSITNIVENLFQIRPDIKNFSNSPFFRRKRVT